MARLAILVATLGMLLGGTAYAQQPTGLKVGDFAPAVEGKDWMNVVGEPPDMVQLRGMVIVLVFMAGFHSGGEAILPLLNLVENNSAFGRASGVMVMGVTDASRSSVQQWMFDHKVLFPVAFESEAAKDYGIEVFPSIVVVNPEGKIAFNAAGGDIFAALLKVLSENPASRMHPEEAAIADGLIAKAHDYVVSGDYRSAFRSIRKAFLGGEGVVGDPRMAEMTETVDLMEVMAWERLLRANTAAESGKFAEAADLVRSVRIFFRGVDGAKLARRLQEKLEKQYDEFKDEMSRFVDDETAAQVLVKARNDLRARRIAEANKALDEIITKYPKTEAAAIAREMLNRMKEHGSVWSEVIDQTCASGKTWLAQARNYIAFKRYPEARELCNKIIRECPDSSYADEAARLLIEEIP